VQEAWIGVDGHREVDLAVTHRGLCRSWSNPPLAQHRSKCVPKGVNVKNAVSVIALGDAGHSQISIQNLAQLVWDGEDWRVGRQLRGNRLAAVPCRVLEAF